MTQDVHRAIRLILLVAALVLAVVSVIPAAAQGGENRAGLVVRYPDGRVETRCIRFPEASITGEQLLQRSGLTAVINPTGAYGGAVCSIQGQGCNFPTQDCFCRCMGSQCEYWAYYHLAPAGWEYSSVGAAAYEVKNEAVDGWSWGPGNFTSGTEPPSASFAEICREGAGNAPGGRPAPGAFPGAQYVGFGVVLLLVLAAGAIVARRRGRPTGA